MEKQNYKNHSRLVPGYHFVTGLAIVALLIGSIVNLVNSDHDNLYSASLIVLIAVILGLVAMYARTFALKAQDRAIRAEENFRHFLLTKRAPDNRLTMQQMIALRFASDEEFPSLAQQAADKKMSSKDIKKSIRSWRGDYYRA